MTPKPDWTRRRRPAPVPDRQASNSRRTNRSTGDSANKRRFDAATGNSSATIGRSTSPCARGRNGPPLSPFRLYNLTEDIGEGARRGHPTPDKPRSSSRPGTIAVPTSPFRSGVREASPRMLRNKRTDHQPSSTGNRHAFAFHDPCFEEFRFALMLLSAMLLSAVVKGGDETPPRPNVVYFLADDLGWGDVGWHGGEIKTPNLDKLAAAGARLEQFYVQPVCSPTRAAFMTGRYPMRHGLQVGVVRPWAAVRAAARGTDPAAGAKEAGYETAIVGKWHLGHVKPEYLPTRRGFDHQYGHYNGALDYFTHVRDDGFDWHRDDRECRDEGYSTHLLAREAVRLVDEHDRSRPLFLYIPFNAVHSPHQVPESYKEPYANLKGNRGPTPACSRCSTKPSARSSPSSTGRGSARTRLFLFSSDNGGPAPGW